MAIDYQAITDELVSVAQRTGLFDSVNAHEPKNAPGKGVHCNVLYMGKRPTLRSGLRKTSVVARWAIQCEVDMLREPQDDIDIDICLAADAIWSALTGNFTLDVAGVRSIDLLGSDGDAMTDEAGYITRDNNMKYRVVVITVPVIINDAFTQAE